MRFLELVGWYGRRKMYTGVGYLIKREKNVVSGCKKTNKLSKCFF